MNTQRFIVLQPALLLALILASCASGPEKSTAAAAPARKSLSERLNQSNGYKQDANGNWKPQNDRRSEFESKGKSNFAGKDFNKQEYKAGDYAKKSWWGNKQYAPKSYSGNTDGSRFEKSSDQQGKGAREMNTTAKIPDNYQTDSYTTSAAREAGTAPLKKGSNAAIDKRQKVFQQPEIIDWREQRSLSVDQSKGILGH